MSLPLLSIFLLLLGTASVLAKHNQSEPDWSPRIVGGTKAHTGQFPHQISLRKRGGHACGGSILSSTYILTAAHCVKQGNNVTPARQLSILAGTLKLSGGGGETRQVAAVHVHPQYKGDGYDVAVLRLTQPLNFNDNAKTISLATEDPPSDASVYISGWGAISNSGPISNDLLYGQVKYLARDTCKRQYLPRLAETTMCLLHEAKKGACYGDSGGPATYEGRLVGVASYVLGGCGRAAPDGYERVSQLRQWIRENAKL
ncbi:serine protease SP24D [Drosophila kikkawai]|uniref:trypsin n=1 Tax=Drosophila kikkawai TaxID=30033 RepID=A0A6P4JU81_DROKI|nr:serine protease SP24D [Drosophila kikkawai]